MAKIEGRGCCEAAIQHAVKAVQSTGRFTVLVLLVCGMDEAELAVREQTMRTVLAAAAVPLSIVIIGIGDGPWTFMRHLDDGLTRRKFDNGAWHNNTGCKLMMSLQLRSCH